MSVRVMAWVFASAPTRSPVEQLVLLAIADHCADDGTGAFPSIGRLAAKTRLSKRSVQRAIASLREGGVLGVEAGSGRAGSNRYAILARQDVACASGAPVSESPSRGDDVSWGPGHGDTCGGDRPPSDPSLESPLNRQEPTTLRPAPAKRLIASRGDKGLADSGSGSFLEGPEQAPEAELTAGEGPPKAPTGPLLKLFAKLHFEKLGAKAAIRSGRDAALMAGIWRERRGDPVGVEDLIRAFFDVDDPWVRQRGYTVGIFKTQIGRLVAHLSKRGDSAEAGGPPDVAATRRLLEED